MELGGCGPTLLHTDGLQGVDLAGAPCRNQNGEEGREEKDRGPAAEAQHVSRAHSGDEALDEARGHPGACDSHDHSDCAHGGLGALIACELRSHAPFTLLGALTGVVLLVLCRDLPEETAHHAFYVLHPGHVLLSAIATASMYHLYQGARKGTRGYLPLLLVIGLVGSIGVATLSDSLIPLPSLGILTTSAPRACMILPFSWLKASENTMRMG